jgi:ubiquinone/menaquinone biosynthesis C-methylase UbiE
LKNLKLFASRGGFLGKNSPGGFELIAYAVQKSGLNKGGRILDVGCGAGETLHEIKERFNMHCVGIDKSDEAVKRGKEQYPDIDIRKGEADFIEFPSYSFEGVILECILSVTEMRAEVIHEAYCVLKNGGKLIVSDLFERGSSQIEGRPEHMKGDAKNKNNSPGNGPDAGMINPAQLIALCEEIGFTKILWEDRSEDLDTFVIEKIMEYGSMDQYFASVIPKDVPKEAFCRTLAEDAKPGYFLLIMEKPKSQMGH